MVRMRDNAYRPVYANAGIDRLLSETDLIARPDFPKSGVFAALYREGGGVEAPRGSSVVDAGTTVLLVAQREEVRRVITALTGPAVSAG
jgi:Trk K+ transport system NAD-binding subunit